MIQTAMSILNSQHLGLLSFRLENITGIYSSWAGEKEQTTVLRLVRRSFLCIQYYQLRGRVELVQIRPMLEQPWHVIMK